MRFKKGDVIKLDVEDGTLYAYCAYGSSEFIQLDVDKELYSKYTHKRFSQFFQNEVDLAIIDDGELLFNVYDEGMI